MSRLRQTCVMMLVVLPSETGRQVSRGHWLTGRLLLKKCAERVGASKSWQRQFLLLALTSGSVSMKRVVSEWYVD